VITGCIFGVVNGFFNTVARPLMLRALIDQQAAGAEAWVLWSLASGLCFVLLLEGFTSMLNRHAIIGRVGVLFGASFTGLAQTHSMKVATAQTKALDAPDVGNLVGNDAVRFQQNLFSLALMPGAALQFVGGTIILLYTIGLAGFVGLTSMCCLLWANMRISQLAKTAERDNLRCTDDRMEVMTQIIHGIRAIKYCAWENSFSRVITKERIRECVPLKLYRVLVQGTVQIGRANPIIGCVFAFLFLALTARDDPESFKPSDIFAALNVFLSLRTGLIVIPEGLIYIATTRVSIRRLQDFLEVPTAPSYLTKHPISDAVRVQDASFTWPLKSTDDGRTGSADEKESIDAGLKRSSLAPGEPLHIQNLQLPKGSFIAVVGSVGSGKSSLVAALLGEMLPSSGGSSVEISANEVALVPQKAFVLSGTVQDNVALGEEKPDLGRLNSALAAAALLQDLERLPKREHTEVGERGIVLSGGQQQRLSIARALYRSTTDLIIADDPISALDPVVADDVFAALKSIVQRERRCTTLMVLNQLWLLPHFDHVVMISGGAIVAQGTPVDLLSRPGPLREFCASSGCDLAAMAAMPLLQVSEASKSSQKAEDEDKDVLVAAEEKLVGSLPLAVLRRYVRGMGYGWFVLCNCMVIAAYGTLAFVDYWLASWVEVRQKNFEEGTEADDNLYVAVYGLAGMTFLILLCSTSYCFTEGGVRSSRNLHEECLNRLLHAPVSFFEATPSGRIFSRFSNDLAIVDKEIPRWVDNVWQISTTAVMLSVQVVALVPMMLPIMVIALFLFIWQVMVINRTNRELRRYANTAMGPVLTTVSETVNGRHVLRPMNAATCFRKRFCHQLDEYHRFSFSAFGTINCGSVFAYLISFLISFSTSSLIIVEREKYEPSFSALALTYSFLLPYFFNIFSQIVQLLMNSLTSLERLLQYGNGGIIPLEPPWHLPSDPDEAVAPWPSAGSVVFEDVSLIYRPGLPKAVDSISFCLQPGEKVGVVGRSGAGKSTLMVLLLRLNEASEGRILVDGLDIAKVGLGRLRKAIAVVPQDPLIITGSIKQNLDPFGEHDESDLARILEEVELDRGLLNTDTSASSLSHGERQLLTLGRTLLWPAKVRVFDEPTSNIDAATDRVIQHLLRSAFGHSTQMTVAHRLQTVMDCDRILVMAEGKLTESGPPKKLLQIPGSQLGALARHAGVNLDDVSVEVAERLEVGPTKCSL